jgi:hypothetical protein
LPCVEANAHLRRWSLNPFALVDGRFGPAEVDIGEGRNVIPALWVTLVDAGLDGAEDGAPTLDLGFRVAGQ